MTITCTRMGRVAALLPQAAAPETSSDEMLIRWIAEGANSPCACCLTGAELLCIAGCCSSSATRL
jgi:hypothetical protein